MVCINTVIVVIDDNGCWLVLCHGFLSACVHFSSYLGNFACCRQISHLFIRFDVFQFGVGAYYYSIVVFALVICFSFYCV